MSTNLTIKNIPPDLYEKLKQSARMHRRSLNSEVIFCLEQTLHSRRIDPDAFLARVDALQKQASIPYLTEEILDAVKKERRL